jgi:acetolactate synthase-1/2/3 large subunit
MTSGQPSPRAKPRVSISDQEWGSDYIADLIAGFGFEFVTFNPGASFRGIEESLVNYRDNDPRVIQVQNEALSVSIAHGYAKATGRPALALMHDTVGTLNGSMSVFNAYVDRAPVMILGGNGPKRKTKRRPWIDWIHTNLDQAGLVRSFTKWDDEPAHTDGVASSLLRAHRIADTRPKGPVYVTLDHGVQENSLEEPIELPDYDKYATPSRIAPDPDAIAQATAKLVDAEFPVIIVDQVGDSREAVDALADLAETLGAPVFDSYGHLPHRFNFPTSHPMNLTGTDAIQQADVVLALDVWSVNLKLRTLTDRATHETASLIDDEFELIDVGLHDLEASSLTHDYNALVETSIPILADTHHAVPALRDAVEDRLAESSGAQKRAEERFKTLSSIHTEQREQWRTEAADARNQQTIAVQQLASDLWETVRDGEWVIVNGTLSGWAHKLWDIDQFDQYVGGMSGGGGVGYGIGAAIGGALAYEDTNRVPINIQSDGDLMQFLGGLWTIAHHDVPLFTVVHNNGCLFNSTNHRMELAAHRGRDASFERALVGTSVTDPTPDYASIAASFGIKGYGPVSDEADLEGVLKSAWSVAKQGKPVLVDVVSQPR